ncbi:MAG: HAD family hydrolase [Oscillatoriophycideae cyanobacterium NC_groundwater_1537_Pr4_S-0.65um_50_18]|nr:HAD family hydrolase [Oscillatoriophycideae cyanobacterium NC_groundwater_1537_Pr4_S-0.65um_50_18]
MPHLQALIFDVDGTLADTERDGHRVAFNRAFVAAGLDWVWSVELYGKLLEITGGKERIRFYLDNYLSDASLPDSFAGSLSEQIASLHAAKTVHYKQLLQENVIPLRPGVKRLLLEAREQGIRLAIATTTTPANVTALLENAIAPEALDWFEVIAAGDIVPAKKPAPDIYEYALQAMNLTPEVCLALEDSRQGLRSAMQAGLKTVITVNGYTQSQDFAGAALVIDHFGEPDLPFQAIAGDGQGQAYFDVALAKYLLAA